jgi:hypothetical protein
MMASSDATKLGDPLGGLVQSFVGVTSIISAVFLAQRLASKPHSFPFFWAACFSWPVMLQFTGGSRTAAISLGIFVTIYAILAPKRKMTIIIPIFGLAVLAYVSALIARGEGEFGLSMLFKDLLLPFNSDQGSSMTNYISNLFQGIFITSDGFDYSAEFGSKYKILSLSPLPSFIDHFVTIRDAEEIRLSIYVPMSAFTEVQKFGIVYTAVFWATVFLLTRKLLTAQRSLGLFYYFVSVYELLMMVEAGAYPTRNVYRQFLYLYVVIWVIQNYVANREGKQTEKKLPPPSTSPAGSRQR